LFIFFYLRLRKQITAGKIVETGWVMRLPRSLRSLAMTNNRKLCPEKNVFIIISHCCDYCMATIGKMKKLIFLVIFEYLLKIRQRLWEILLFE